MTLTGSAFAWGSNGFGGRVGDGTTIDRFAPVPVLNSTDVTAIGMGLGHACEVHSTGIASCWGDNSGGQLGNGTLTTSSAPVNVVGLTNVKAIAAGSLHTCAVKTDGSVWCWGQNVGDLGDGTVDFRNQSTPIRAL